MRPVFLKQVNHAQKNVRNSSSRFRRHFSSYKRMRTPIAALAVVVVLSVVVLVVRAAAINWNNTGTDYNAGASWTGGVAPGAGDVGQFPAAAGTQPNLSASLSNAGLHFSTSGSSGYVITRTNNAVFTFTGQSPGTTETGNIDSAAIKANNTSGTNTINVPISLAPATGFATFNQAANGTLVVDGVISGSALLILPGSGTVQLNGANLYTNGTSVTAGTLQIGDNSALGTGLLTLGGTGANTPTITASGAARTIANNISLGAVTTGTATIAGANNLTVNGSLTATGASRTLTINNSGLTTFSNVFLTDTATAGRTLVGLWHEHGGDERRRRFSEHRFERRERDCQYDYSRWEQHIHWQQQHRAKRRGDGNFKP
jgi:autotransporter-associated beta strand protein